MVNNFEKVLKSSPPGSFPKLEIKIHATMTNSKRHKKLANRLKKLMTFYNDRFSDSASNKNVSIFFDVTASIFEALETGVEAIHICSNPLLQSYSEKIWADMRVKRLNNFTYSYSLKSLGQYIDFGDDNISLNKFLKILFYK